jgi:2-dehydro-3-deoxy-D-arabinonate dehydratase
VRFCAVWDPEQARPALCAVDAGALRPVGGHGDIAELVAAAARGATLAEAAVRAGLGKAIARWDEVEDAEPRPDSRHLLPPARPAEVWAAGVTYERSRDARVDESREGDIYDRVYDAERPELFLKATAPRIVGPNAPVGLRADSAWQVPEPELALVLGEAGAVLGYTLGNDMSSRDIEGENPLYLPQAKIFAGSCALGPLVVSADDVADPYDLEIRLRVERGGETVFEGATSTARLHARLQTLTAYLARDNWLAPATVLLTGTGVVPPDGFTLAPGDLVEVSCPAVGVLRNRCAPASELAPPAAWIYGVAGSR